VLTNLIVGAAEFLWRLSECHVTPPPRNITIGTRLDLPSHVPLEYENLFSKPIVQIFFKGAKGVTLELD
jgi:hypothetical protein